ncbi:unnamed protein product [Closterium sp. NIES-65]|nr:unnamed protein product [Closterium sp. NIES-65]
MLPVPVGRARLASPPLSMIPLQIRRAVVASASLITRLWRAVAASAPFFLQLLPSWRAVAASVPPILVRETQVWRARAATAFPVTILPPIRRARTAATPPFPIHPWIWQARASVASPITIQPRLWRARTAAASSVPIQARIRRTRARRHVPRHAADADMKSARRRHAPLPDTSVDLASACLRRVPHHDSAEALASAHRRRVLRPDSGADQANARRRHVPRHPADADLESARHRHAPLPDTSVDVASACLRRVPHHDSAEPLASAHRRRVLRPDSGADQANARRHHVPRHAAEGIWRARATATPPAVTFLSVARQVSGSTALFFRLRRARLRRHARLRGIVVINSSGHLALLACAFLLGFVIALGLAFTIRLPHSIRRVGLVFSIHIKIALATREEPLQTSPATSLFATAIAFLRRAVIMLGKFLEVKRALRAVVISQEWEEVAVAQTEEGMEPFSVCRGGTGNRLTAKKMPDVTIVAFIKRARDAFDQKAAVRARLYADLGNGTLKEGCAIISAESEDEEGEAEEELSMWPDPTRFGRATRALGSGRVHHLCHAWLQHHNSTVPATPSPAALSSFAAAVSAAPPDQSDATGGRGEKRLVQQPRGNEEASWELPVRLNVSHDALLAAW